MRAILQELLGDWVGTSEWLEQLMRYDEQLMSIVIDSLNRFEALPQVSFSLHGVILGNFGLVWPLSGSSPS